LNPRFGAYGQKGESQFHLRNGSAYKLPKSVMQNTDVERIIQSDEVQSVIRDRKIAPGRQIRKKNPLKNLYAMVKLNPLALSTKRQRVIAGLKKSRKEKKKTELGSKFKPTQKDIKTEKFLKKSEKQRAETKKNFFENIIQHYGKEVKK